MSESTAVSQIRSAPDSEIGNLADVEEVGLNPDLETPVSAAI